MWVLFVVLYVVLVALAALLAHGRAPAAEVLTKQKLPHHHLVVPGDLNVSRDLGEDLVGAIVAPYVGKYASGVIGEKKVLALRELSATPLLEKQKGAQRSLFPVRAEHVLSGKINAELQAHLCTAVPVPIKVTVVTVLCAPGVRDPCNAIVDLPADVPPNAANKLGQGAGEILPQSIPTCS